jgi:tRNA dimethylallyltransferase
MSFPPIKTVIIVCGPTAAGKTAAAITLAKYFQTQIISADSRQCFKELNIGVARPGEKDLQEVPHHFIASYSIQDNINAALFEQYALKKVIELFGKNNIVIMIGGTGLYIKAFCEGLDAIPDIDPQIRDTIVVNYNNGGIEWLREQVEKYDPFFILKGEIKNPQRMMRALEVKLSTGRSILSFHTSKQTHREFRIIKIGLNLPKEELHRNISVRVDKMIETGLVDEVKNLIRFKNLNALQTVGYTEIFNYLENKITLEKAVEEIKKNTRQYAKRQITWFRKDKEIKWFLPTQINEIIAYCQKQVGTNL